jgi:hypothetical protein
VSGDEDNRWCIPFGNLPLKVQATHARQLQIQLLNMREIPAF